jgi:TonB family protein
MALLALALVLAAAAQPGDRRPVPLRNPPLVSPVEAAGTGIAPEVTVKVEVDARGRAAKVEVLKIQPSTALDDAFREQAVHTLSGWRFAPAIEGGAAVPATLQWTILFRPLAEDELPGLPIFTWNPSPFGVLETTAEARSRRVLGLPLQQQLAFLGELARKADSLIAPERRREAETPLFKVVTDSGDAKLTQTVAQNLEAVYGTLARWFGDRIAPAPARGRVLVYLFDKRSTYADFARIGGAEQFGGFYSPPGLIAFHREVPTNAELLSALIHETVHAFVDRHLARPGVHLPKWLGEGLAEYVGNSSVQKGHLVPGKTPRVMPILEYGVFVKTHQAMSFTEVKTAIKKGLAIPLDTLVNAGPQEFYGEKVRLYYPQAWLFVHFLRHGREGWQDDAFPVFLLYMAEGFDPQASFRAAYGSTPSELETAFREYVRVF